MTRTIAFLTIVLASTLAEAADASDVVRIGVAYQQTQTGRRHLAGVKEAVKDRGADKLVKIEPLPYGNELQGVEKF